jgi:hypothetical protein
MQRLYTVCNAVFDSNENRYKSFLSLLIPIQLMIATHPWFKTRRHVLQRGEPPQRSGS